MRIGSKKIFHLEAWVIKVMSLQKVCPRSHGISHLIYSRPRSPSHSLSQHMYYGVDLTGFD